MSYDAELTVDLAVAERLARERQALAAVLAASRPLPATRPADITLPSPQLIPAPAAAAELSQGGSAHPVAEALTVIAGANEQATRSPTPGGFLNAIHYYDYAPGVRYNVVAAAGYLTAIQLRPGERLLSLSSSDTAAYHVDQVEQGSADGVRQTLILLKPKGGGGGQSNWVITTNERTYFVDVLVNPEPNFQSAIAWHYPLDGLRVAIEQDAALRVQLDGPAVAQALPEAAGQEAVNGEVVGPLGMNLADLNFGYVVLYQERGVDGKTIDAPAPAWSPLRVFDDGRKTYLHFPPQVRSRELPPLYALDHPEAEDGRLVNYRRSGDYLIADGLAPAWRLRAGEAPQQIVTVARGKANDPAAFATGGRMGHGMSDDQLQAAVHAEPTTTSKKKPRRRTTFHRRWPHR
jgi:type IV secretion system protein VirB9